VPVHSLDKAGGEANHLCCESVNQQLNNYSFGDCALFRSGVSRGGQLGASAPGRQRVGAPKGGLKSFINFSLQFDAAFLCD